MSNLQVEIISFGNELLIGEIINTNSQWLAQKITKLGLIVTRMLTLSDDLDVISNCFSESVKKRPAPNFIITTGGLGPTWDDKTLEGLSLAFNDDFIFNKDALVMIKARYKQMNISLSKGSKQMAQMPKKALPLLNSAGTAPGVLYEINNCKIFCLPGVPSEMKAIFYDHISPNINEKKGNINFYEQKFNVSGSYESKIAGITSKFVIKYPSIYIKSHPQKSNIYMHITTYGEVKDMELLEKVTKELKVAISEIGLILE